MIPSQKTVRRMPPRLSSATARSCNLAGSARSSIARSRRSPADRPVSDAESGPGARRGFLRSLRTSRAYGWHADQANRGPSFVPDHLIGHQATCSAQIKLHSSFLAPSPVIREYSPLNRNPFGRVFPTRRTKSRMLAQAPAKSRNAVRRVNKPQRCWGLIGCRRWRRPTAPWTRAISGAFRPKHQFLLMGCAR